MVDSVVVVLQIFCVAQLFWVRHHGKLALMKSSKLSRGTLAASLQQLLQPIDWSTTSKPPVWDEHTSGNWSCIWSVKIRWQHLAQHLPISKLRLRWAFTAVSRILKLSHHSTGPHCSGLSYSGTPQIGEIIGNPWTIQLPSVVRALWLSSSHFFWSSAGFQQSRGRQTWCTANPAKLDT